MKKFLLKLLLFLLPVSFSLFVLDNAITAILKKSRKADFSVWNDLTEGRINSDIVIYGSSRAWVHFDPKIFEDSLQHRVYNLGVDGYRFGMQWYRHELLLQLNKKPSLIVHALDFNTLETQTDLYNAKQFLPYIENGIIRKATKKYNGLNFYDYHLPFVRYHGQSQAIYNAIGILLNPLNNKNDRYNGFQGQDRQWTEEFEKAKSKKNQYAVTIDPSTLFSFKEYLKDLKGRSIDVVLVYPPEYIEGQHYVSNRQQVLDLYRSIAAENKIRFLDYSDSAICKDRSKFYNSMHLNKEGAELFSRQLAHLLKQKRIYGE